MKTKTVIIAVVIWLLCFAGTGYFLFFHTSSKAISTTPPDTLTPRSLSRLEQLDRRIDNPFSVDIPDSLLDSFEPRLADYGKYGEPKNLDWYEEPLRLSRADSIETSAQTRDTVGSVTVIANSPKNDRLTEFIINAMDKDSVKIMERLTKTATPGSLAIGSYKLYKTSVSSSIESITKDFTSHGVLEPHATKGASKIWMFLKGNVVKRATVTVGLGSAALAVQSLIFPGLSFWQRTFIAISVASLALGVFVLAQRARVIE